MPVIRDITRRARIPPMRPPAQMGKLEALPLSAFVSLEVYGYQVFMGLVYGVANSWRRELFVQEGGEVRVAKPVELVA